MLINGIASGDTTETSTILWARSDELGDVTFEYSTTSDFSEIAGTVTTTVSDVEVPVKVSIDDLEPDTQYYYRVEDSEGDRAVGELVTPAAEGETTGVNFGIINCNYQGAVPYVVMENIPEQDLDFLINLGDTIYQDGPVPTQPSLPDIATEIPDMRAKYSETLVEHFDVNYYADARASTSLFSAIDDHEVINNFYGAAPAAEDERFPETEGLINETEFYDNALQTFAEYAPLEEKVYEGTDNSIFEGRPDLYRSQSYGDDAVMIMPDTRSFRDQFLDPESPTFFEDSITLDRTMLGELQLEELKQDLLAAEESGVTWKFVATSVEMQQWGRLFAEDRWEGYANERNEILQFIDENQIDNVVFVAGDWHGYNVNNLTYQTEPDGEQIATNAFEVVVGPGGSNPYGPGWTGTADLTQEEQELFDSLPIAPDTDDIIDDKDDFTKQKVIDAGMEPGYDPMGLDNNLPQAEGLIDAELIEGDYVGNFHLSWTDFDIDEDTQKLTVTTYGILPYTVEEIPDDPSILEREPEIISQFVVNPQVDTTLESLTGSLSEFIGVEDGSYFIEVPDGQIDEFFDWDANYPQLISAHRGGFLPGFPENAIATFENTLATAPALLEVDVRRTADGEWILMHDDDLDRTTTGTGLVEETTLAEIQTLQLKDNDGNLTPYKVPTLQEAILWAEGKTILELDLKSDDYAGEVAEIITELDGEDQVRFITQDIEQATEVHNINPEIHLGVFVIPENQEQVFAEIENAPFTLDKISAFTGTQPQSAEFYDSLHDEEIVAIQGLFGGQDTFDGESINDLSNEQRDTLFNTVFDNGADAIAADYYQDIASLIGYEDINVLDIEPDIIDLTSFTAEVSAVNDAGFENIGGFYQAIDNTGTVIDPLTGAEVAVGDAGYEDTALANSVVEIGNGDNTTLEFDGGFVYVPYLLADGEQFFTAYAEANPDSLDHVQSQGENTFGFEDLLGGGDNDFNDFVISFDIF